MPAGRCGYDVEALRRAEFPWTQRGDAIYLNNASTGPLPRRTVATLAEWAALRAEPFRISDALIFETLARTRRRCAELIGASPAEIALFTNTSYGINLAARALPLAPGDVVLTFDREFPANVYPWMALEADGISLVRIPTVNGLPDEDTLLLALDRPGVRAVSVSWVQFATGYRADLARIGRACRERAIYFVVDAMQGLGPLTLDVEACHIDVLACGGQKWLLAPWGSGFAYVRAGLIPELEPKAVGWMAVKGPDDFSRLTDYQLVWRSDARRFEVLTVPVQDLAGLSASLELLFELGPDAVATHAASLADHIVDWARLRDDIRLVTPAEPSRRAAIVAVAPPDPQVASERLTAAGIAHSFREGAIRLSPHLYNTLSEIDRALEVLGGSRR